MDWSFNDSKSNSLHSIHPYPAKFIPELPKEILSRLEMPPNSIVFDPFCGSGVTLTEAQTAGFPTVGVDLNPIACLLSRVKSCPNQFDISRIAKEIVERCKRVNNSVEIPPIKNLDHWFKKGIQRKISVLVAEIKKIEDPDIRDTLNFSLSANLVRLSNQDSDTRYAAIEKKISDTEVFPLFLKTAERLKRAKNKQVINSSARVINKNSLLLDSEDLTEKIGITITSPPYPNAYEYWLYHKYRMWWLGYDAEKVKSDEIGARAHYFKKNHQTADDFVNQMNVIFEFLYENSVQGAYSIFIIGRSKIHGEIINNERIIEEAGLRNDFKHIATIARSIKSSRKSFNLSHARIKEEYLVIHQK